MKWAMELMATDTLLKTTISQFKKTQFEHNIQVELTSLNALFNEVPLFYYQQLYWWGCRQFEFKHSIQFFTDDTCLYYSRDIILIFYCNNGWLLSTAWILKKNILTNTANLTEIVKKKYIKKITGNLFRISEEIDKPLQ